MKIDQVTLAGPADAGNIDQHYRACRRYNSAVDRCFYVVPNFLADELESEHKGENLIIIKESIILDPETCPNKWIYQQLLKLNIDQLRTSHNLSETFLFTVSSIDSMLLLL